MKKIIFIITLVSFLSSCLKEEDSKKPFKTYIPKELNDGWEISSPENEGVNSQSLNDLYVQFHNSEETWQARSLLIIRNGKLIAESYTKDEEDITSPVLIQSCTKQVVGILTGIALEQGVISNLNDPISDYIPQALNYGNKKDITIEQLLTMRSGIKYENGGMQGDNFDLLRQKPDNLIDYILGKPMAYQPGKIAVYKDCDPHLLAISIQNKTGKKTSEWAKDVLFDPLNIKNITWLNYKDGYTLGGQGILATPRELAKIGLMVLDSGNYKGNQVVSRQWIKDMTTVREQNINGTQFGYLWRLDKYNGWNMMMGHGGQLVCIVPGKNLIVVITAEADPQGEFQMPFSFNFNMVKRIIRSCN